MAVQTFTDNAKATLASSITNIATSLTLATGKGALFPALSGGDWFMLTLTQALTETSWEIVKVTARSGDVLTIVRAQEGTTAAAWAAADKAELRITAGLVNRLATLDDAQTLDAKTLTGVPRINGGATSGLKEKIVNGRMEIDQRNSGASVNPAAATTTYLVDRFCAYVAQTSKLAFQQVVDGPPGFKNSLKVTVSAQYSPGAAEQFILWQPIEGVNCIDLALGTASAQSFTVRANLKSTVPGTYPCWIGNGSNRSYVGTVAVGTGWTSQSLLVPGDVTGTWAIDNSAGLLFGIDLGSGTNFNTTAGSWQVGTYRRASGAVTFVNQVAGSTLNITGVSLKAGDCRNELYNEWRPYPLEEMLCYRYLPVTDMPYNRIGQLGYTRTSVAAVGVTTFRAQPRVAPTGMSILTATTFSFSANGTNYSLSSPTFWDAGLDVGSINFTAAGLPAATGAIYTSAGAGGKILWTGCEL